MSPENSAQNEEEKEQKQDSIDELAGDLARLAHRAKWDELDEAWLQLMGSLDTLKDSPKFGRMFEEVSKRRSPTSATTMMELLLEESAGNEAADAKAVLTIFERGYPHGLATGSMRESLGKLLKRISEPERAEEIIKVTSLNDEETTAKAAVDSFIRYYRLRPGEVFHHKYYEIGIVRDVSFTDEVAKMDFPDASYKDITVKFEHTEELLSTIPGDHFDVLRLSQPEAIKELGDTDPGQLIRRIAEARRGEVKQSMIKTILIPVVFTDAQFKTWWGKKRAEIVRDPYLDVTGAGASATFKLRSAPKPYHEELLVAFDGAKKLKARYDAAKNICRAARDDAFPDDAWTRALGPLRQAAIESDKLAAHEKLIWELIRRDFEKFVPEGTHMPPAFDVVGILKAAPRPDELLLRLEQPDYIAAFIPALEESHPKQYASLRASLAGKLPPRYASSIIKDLLAEDNRDEASEALQSLISFPERNAEGYVWATKGLLEGDLDLALVGLDQFHLAEGLLDELEKALNDNSAVSDTEEKALKNLQSKLLKFLEEKEYKVICSVVEKMPLKKARTFYAELENRRIPEEMVGRIRTALRKTRNDLEETKGKGAKGKKGGAEHDDAVLLCKEESLTAKQAEYRQINSVEIPANSKAIGAAAELGDLKENAEYHSAKEHQKVLFARVEELTMQINRARPVQPEAIDTKKVSFGTRVTVKDEEKGEELQYTILGPWESDPSQKILSYQSPLGGAFLDKKVDQKFQVELPDGTKHKFSVVSIEKAL